MPQFLTTSGTSHWIENIIIKAKSELLFITPYLKLSPTLVQRLTETDRRNVRIQLVYGKSELHPNEKRQLEALANLELFYLENLHAKCYLNEHTLVVSSMNLYEFSEKNNREMGILLTPQEDGECFADALAEARSILAAAKRVSGRKPVTDTRPRVVVDHRSISRPAAPTVPEPSPEKLPYDQARMTQKLFALLKKQPTIGESFVIAITPHPLRKDQLFATITADNFPRRGIKFTFKGDLRYDFEDSENYKDVKRCQGDELERKLSLVSSYRCYWNQDVLQIYGAKNRETTDEESTAEYFLNAVLSTAGVLKWYPFPAQPTRL